MRVAAKRGKREPWPKYGRLVARRKDGLLLAWPEELLLPSPEGRLVVGSPEARLVLGSRERRPVVSVESWLVGSVELLLSFGGVAETSMGE
jgi:hypothetical protein